MRSVHLLALGALILPMVASAGFAVSSFKKTSRTSENGSYGAAAALDGEIDNVSTSQGTCNINRKTNC